MMKTSSSDIESIADNINLKQYNFQPEYTAEEVNEMENNSALIFFPRAKQRTSQPELGAFRGAFVGIVNQ